MAKTLTAGSIGSVEHMVPVCEVNSQNDNTRLTSQAEPSVHLSILRQIVNQWNGVAVVMDFHRPTGTWIFIAIHDTTLGPAVGGSRIWIYPSPEMGLRDALSLAEGMTAKWAIIGSPCGGGKAVLALRRPVTQCERDSLLQHYGQMLQDLGGKFRTAGDLGTTESDLATLSHFTKYVDTSQPELRCHFDSGLCTAKGIRSAIEACLTHVFGDNSLRGRSVLIQGVGKVGGHLARLVNNAGGRVTINDIDEELAQRIQVEISCEVVSSDAVYQTECDVFAPCGVGGILNRETLPLLGCRIIAGGANNQLENPAIAGKLDRRGILYAPDYIVNAGCAVALSLARAGADESQVNASLESIGETLNRILDEASRSFEYPLIIAERQVSRILEKAKSERS